ncbi:hypothetical protein PoB_003334900 [Plakobranchus ocellatus]|uniref:Uncharacterized protein n=1 Tax=Plakobranchus ocellatus TaxID=259542 RepID=A0AAV4AGN6_9GAST|nr:hypothetical protein PoB_003334900 [Plakobranchus ocellatus]
MGSNESPQSQATIDCQVETFDEKVCMHRASSYSYFVRATSLLSSAVVDVRCFSTGGDDGGSPPTSRAPRNDF